MAKLNISLLINFQLAKKQRIVDPQIKTADYDLVFSDERNPMHLSCACGSELNVPEHYAGKKVRCPACEQVVDVPEIVFDATEVYAAHSTSVKRQCHEVEYEIVGDDLQMVIVELDPHETVVAEAGAMTYMEEGINFETKMGDGSAVSYTHLTLPTTPYV